MPILTAAELKQSIADSLQTPLSTLPASWDRHSQRAVDDAWRDIVEIFTTKGYTTDQIEAWPRLASIHESQSKYWAFVHGAGLHNFSDIWVNKFDMRREMRENLAITDANGIIIGAGEPGFIIAGRFDTTDDQWTRDTQV